MGTRSSSYGCWAVLYGFFRSCLVFVSFALRQIAFVRLLSIFQESVDSARDARIPDIQAILPEECDPPVRF